MYQICTLPSIHVHAYDGKCKMFTLYNCTFYNLKRRSFKEDLQQCTHLINYKRLECCVHIIYMYVVPPHLHFLDLLLPPKFSNSEKSYYHTCIIYTHTHVLHVLHTLDSCSIVYFLFLLLPALHTKYLCTILSTSCHFQFCTSTLYEHMST